MSNVILSELESSLALKALRFYMEQQKSDDAVVALERKLQSAEKVKITVEPPKDSIVETTDGAEENLEKPRPPEYSYFYVMIEDEQWPYTNDDEESAAHDRMREKGIMTVPEFGIHQETDEVEEIRQITLKD